MNKGLDILKFNHAGALLKKDGTTINYGVISIDSEKMEYYTGKGLREMWSPNMTEEQREKAEDLKKLTIEEQRRLELRDVIYLSDIIRVLF